MVSTSRLLLTVLIPPLLVYSDGRNIWNPLMSEVSVATPPSRQPDLCQSLLTVMGEVDTAAPLCKSFPDSVSGNI